MPRDELLKPAAALSTQLGKTLDVDNLDDAALAALVAQLQAEADAASASAAKKKPKATAGSYVVAEGCSITTKRGIVGAGEPISAADLEGGDEAFAALTNFDPVHIVKA